MRQVKRVTITFRPFVLLAVIINFYFHLNRKPDAVELYYIILTHYNIYKLETLSTGIFIRVNFFSLCRIFYDRSRRGIERVRSDRKDLTIILHDHLNNMLLISLSLLRVLCACRIRTVHQHNSRIDA